MRNYKHPGYVGVFEPLFATLLQINIFASMLRINYDALGIAASIACAIHCALLPIFLSSLTILGMDIVNNMFFEAVMIALAALIGYRSLRHGFLRHHHSKIPLAVFAIGMGFLILKQVWHERQLLFLLPAVGAIVTAHILNIRYCRKTDDSHPPSCRH